MGNAAVFNRCKHLDSLIPSKAGIGQKSFDDFSAYSLAVLNVGFAASLLIGFTFLLSRGPVRVALPRGGCDRLLPELCGAPLR